MNRSFLSICAAACLAALPLPCVAQDNPWNGSWKLDASSVKYDGPSFSVATDADGYTITRGGKASPKVVCDGQPKTAPDGTTTKCTKVGTGYIVETSKDGKLVSKATVAVASDGQTMTRKLEFSPADEAPYTMTFTSKLVSGGKGEPSVWKQTNVQESQDTGVLTVEVKGDSIAFKETDVPKPVTSKLDGTETKFSDTGTVSMQLADPHTLKVTYRGDGQVRRENTFLLSPDGKTIMETDVTPDPSPSTTSMVFHKQ